MRDWVRLPGRRGRTRLERARLGARGLWRRGVPARRGGVRAGRGHQPGGAAAGLDGAGPGGRARRQRPVPDRCRGHHRRLGAGAGHRRPGGGPGRGRARQPAWRARGDPRHGGVPAPHPLGRAHRAGRADPRPRPADERDADRLRRHLAGAVQHDLRPRRCRSGRQGDVARLRVRPAWRDHPGGPAQRLAVHRHRDPAGVLHRDHPQYQHRVPHRPDQRQRDRRIHRRGEHRRREHLAGARGRAVGRAAGPGRERGAGVGRAPGPALAPRVLAGPDVSRASGRLAARWAVIAAAVVLWQVWARRQGSSFFPPPSAIAARMYQQWFSGPAAHLFLTPDAAGNVLPSVGRIAAGLAIAVVAGGVAGVAIGRSVALSGYLDPLLQFARALPAVTLVPVFIALFPPGTEMEVATIAFGTVWPILLNTIDGARSVDPLQLETARAFRLPGWQRLTKLIIPATMPRFFAGLRLSVSLALVLMVFAELAGSSNGIGYEMNNAQSSFDMTWVWATIVLLALLGNLFNQLELAAEHRMLGWHRGARGRMP